LFVGAPAALAVNGSGPIPRGHFVRITQGKLPSGADFRFSARRFGRKDLCLSLDAPPGAVTTCPVDRRIFASISVNCDGDTVVSGSIGSAVKALRVKFGDGRRVRATLYPPIPSFKLRTRYFLGVAKGPVSADGVRALDSRGRTYALGRFRLHDRCRPGLEFGGDALFRFPAAGRRARR
jgi:hypothetical protein